MDKDKVEVELAESASIQIIEEEPDGIIPGRNRATLRREGHVEGVNKKSPSQMKKAEHWLKKI